MARRKNRSSLSTVTDIDVTPLVDLTFILLIVFMVTSAVAKSMVKLPEYGEPVKVPKETRIIWVDEKGNYIYNKIKMTEEELLESLTLEKEEIGEYAVGGDERRPYGDIIKLMKIINKAGITNVSLITNSEE